MLFWYTHERSSASTICILTINSSMAQSYGFVSSRGPHFSANVCCFTQSRQLIKIVDVCKKQHQGPAKTQVLLICMDSQHILEKNTWQQRNAWCLTPQWGWNSPGVVGSAGVCDGRVSFCACGTQGAYKVNKNNKQMVTFPAIIFSPEVCDYFAWGRFIVPD